VQNNHLLPPSLQNRGDREADRWKRGGAPATQAMGTTGMWGKTERRSRATHSAPHLGRGRTVEGDRRRRAICNPERHGRRWWWRWRARGGGGIGRGGAGRGGEPVRPFYRCGKVGSVKIFELQELRWPGEKNILALTLGRRASGQRGAVDGTLRAGSRCGCGGGDRPEGRNNGGGDRWSSPVRAMEGEGRHGLAGCGAGLGVPRRRACWPGSARGEGGAGAGPGREIARGVGGRGLGSRQEPPKEEEGGKKKVERKRRKRKRKRKKMKI
jgi:hypothetical protein